MAFDAFLKLTGIVGESTDAKHKDEIEVLSYSFGASNGTNAGAGGGGAGKVQFQDFHFVSRLQSSSPQLFLACASGQHIKEATLTVRKAGGEQQEFLKLRMSDVFVASFQQGGSPDSGDSLPIEQVSINYSKLDIDYSKVDSKGGIEGTVVTSWDLKSNKGG